MRRAALAAHLATAGLWLLSADSGGNRGEGLYTGKLRLEATLAGSSDILDSAASRCVNCHSSNGAGSAEAGLRATDIRPQTLQRAAARRGGPPSRYNLQSFCAALRTGQDAAGVVLSRGMPRYRISYADCARIWAYLSE